MNTTAKPAEALKTAIFNDEQTYALRAAIHTQVKSLERAARHQQTQGRATMADVYLLEARILQQIEQEYLRK